MGFYREAAGLGASRGVAILGVPMTIAGLIAFLLTGSFWPATTLMLGFLAFLSLDLARQFWSQRNKAQAKARAAEDQRQRKREEVEESAEFRIDALLKRALDLEGALRGGNREGLQFEKEQRRAVLHLIIDSQYTVRDCAPAHVKDLAAGPAEGSGRRQLLNAVDGCYRVLATVRKQL